MQVMSTRNRERVAKDGLEAVVKMTREYAGDLEMAKAATGLFHVGYKICEHFYCWPLINNLISTKIGMVWQSGRAYDY